MQKWILAALFSSLAGLCAQPVRSQAPVRLHNLDWRTDWSKSSIDFEELESNVPRDAIPSIDSPLFESVAEASLWVGGGEPVVLVTKGGEAKAYPLQVLIWHEVVTDEIDGVPISVTFCPLCYSALVFDRRVDGDVYDFGVSGMLRHSDLVMFDRQTHTLWQQLSGEAIVGTLNGKVLNQIPAQIISFEQLRKAFPQGLVLSKETGHQRPYGENPYPGYDDIKEKPWLFRGRVDDRLPPMEKVVTVTIGGVHKAYPHSATRERGVIHDTVGEIPLVVFHTKDGATSAMDKTSIARSRTIGSTGVFSPVTGDGSLLQFKRDGDRFRDTQTRSTWDITGRAVGGELQGTQLDPIAHGDIFSFAWLVVYPGSEVYTD